MTNDGSIFYDFWVENDNQLHQTPQNVVHFVAHE